MSLHGKERQSRVNKDISHVDTRVLKGQKKRRKKRQMMHNKRQKKKDAEILYQRTGALRGGGIQRWRGRDVTLFRHTFSVVVTTLLAGPRYATTE